MFKFINLEISCTIPFRSSLTRVFNSLVTMDVCTDNGKSGTAYLKFVKFIYRIYYDY